MAPRIMVVDGSQAILELFREILEEEGYEVVLYTYAIQDVAEVERVQPDLIILDHLFGEEKLGWQMLQKLKLRRSTEAIPVVVCTTQVTAVQEMEGYLTAHGVGVVLKPFDINDLLSTVSLALENRAHTAPVDTTDEGTNDPRLQAHETFKQAQKVGAEQLRFEVE